MSNIEIICENIDVNPTSKYGKPHILAVLHGITEDEVLEQLDTDDIIHYVVNNTSIIKKLANDSDVLNTVLEQYSYSQLKEHYKVDILDEICSENESDILSRIGWESIKQFFKDEIDAYATDIATDMLARNVI